MKSSKADKLLGLTEQGDEESKITVQKEGWLGKADVGARVKTFKRHWTVVKDGFVLFYGNKDDRDGPFDTKPKLVMPLGGAVCSVELKDRRVILMKHPDVPGAAFRVKSDDPGEAMDWMVAFDAAKKATWENALLGNALIEKMQATGSKLEAEKEEAFQALQDKAQRLAKEQEQAEKASARDAERAKAFQSKLATEKQRVTQLEQRRTEMAGRVSKEERLRLEAAKKRMSVERKLAEAEAALTKLEAAMIVRGGAAPQREFQREDNEVRASVSALRSFFEARAREQAVRARALYEKLAGP